MTVQKNVLIIYTGGTIGMVPSSHGLAPDKHFPERLKHFLPDNKVDILSLSPLIDSASATPQNWQQIADTIKARQVHYEAFIVLHGTDTLAYTAAALHLMMAGLGKPIVITGSQRPFGLADSDAENNIEGALVTADKQQYGVSVFFDNVVLPADSVKKVHAQADHAFTSNRGILAEWDKDKKRLTWRQQPPYDPHKTDYLAGTWRGFLPHSVATLYITPDMPVSCFEAVLSDTRIQGIVLLSFGSGNLPERSDLGQAIEQALARGVSIINVTQCAAGYVVQDAYASGAGKLGVISGDDMTPEYAYVFLHYAAANNA